MPSSQEDRDRSLEALLEQGRLSGRAKERIFEAALAASGAGKSKPAAWRRAAVWGLPMAAAAALLLFVTVRPLEYRSRGVAGAVLDVGCRDGALAACPSGSMLLFRAGGSGEGGFLTAWAVPENGGERIWYFPTEAGEAPAFEARAETQTLGRGIRLGPEQPAGRYRVHLVLSRRALTRDEAVAPPPDAVLAEADVTLAVTP